MLNFLVLWYYLLLYRLQSENLLNLSTLYLLTLKKYLMKL